MVTAYFDGACEPTNPGGHCTDSFVIYENDKRIYEYTEYIGSGPGMSNNVAEYQGVYNALKYLIQHNLAKNKINIYGDSKLVINQMKGIWRIKQGLYKPIAFKTLQLKQSFSNIYFDWIPRERNKECDILTKEVLLNKGIMPHSNSPLQNNVIEEYNRLAF